MTWASTRSVASILAEHHYLGSIRRGVAWHDEFGVIVITQPTARHLPTTWIELARWCITSAVENSGSRQWARFARALRAIRADATTVVSYSDPSAGHTGALYRACNWWWAPTWHRLRPPPTGNGAWTEGDCQSEKDRWIFPLRADLERANILLVRDEAILRKRPDARYCEPGGVPFKAFHDELARGAAP